MKKNLKYKDFDEYKLDSIHMACCEIQGKKCAAKNTPSTVRMYRLYGNKHKITETILACSFCESRFTNKLKDITKS